MLNITLCKYVNWNDNTGYYKMYLEYNALNLPPDRVV